MKILSILFLLIAQLWAADVVDLTVKETAGLARTNEDITMGVPLPEGRYTDITRFALKNAAGTSIPCEFKTLSKWFKDSTQLRWIQLNFPFSVAANDSPKVYLTYESGSQSLSSKLTVSDQGTYFLINTGKIRFQVKKANFNLIDQAWVDESGAENYTTANQIVSAHSRGLIYFENNVEFLSSNDAASTVTVTRQGPGMITLTARGSLKNSGGTAPLHFICRLYAFNNSTTVRIYQTVENWDATPEHFVSFQGLHSEIPLTLGASRTGFVGKPGGFEQASLSGAADLYCMVDRPDTSTTTMGQNILGTIGGAVTGSFTPKISKPKDIGWAALSDGSKGCLAAMKYFWQMVPASAEAFGDGKLILGLFSKRAAFTPIHFYAGAARTYETQFTFFNSRTGDQCRSNAAASTERLFAVASSAWYSRIAVAAFPMMEANKPSFYKDSSAIWVPQWESKLNNQWNTVLASDNLLHSFDSYGFLEWGDNPHYVQPYSFPWSELWNGNYYGMDFMAFEHFFHNRDVRFLNYGISHARHVQDIHMVHFGPSATTTGGCRYCPPAYHFSEDDDPAVTPGTFWIDNPSHHKIEGLYLDYYLTGNDYALEVANQGAFFFNKSGTYYTTPGQEISVYIRRWAHEMYALTSAYECTRNPVYYTTLCQNWDAFKKDIANGDSIQSFLVGLGMEAVVKMHAILSPTYRTGTGQMIPDSIPFYLKKWADRVLVQPIGTASLQINGNTALGYAFLSRFYGDAYKSYANARTQPAFGANLHKDFAQQGRNMEMAMYYMATPESLVVPMAVEKKASSQPLAAAVNVNVCPSPFTSSTQIQIEGSKIWKNSPIEVKIFSADGKLVNSWTTRAESRLHTLHWNARNLATGIYLVRCRAAGMEVVRRVTLLK